MSDDIASQLCNPILLRALRSRGGLTINQCKAVVSNAGNVASIGGSQRATILPDCNTVILNTEHSLLQKVPVYMSRLTRAERVLYIEQQSRLPLKRLRSGLILRKTALNATSKSSLLRALCKMDSGVTVAQIASDYPRAQADLIELQRAGKVVVIGNTAWAVPYLAKVPGAAEAWLMSAA